jgi:hydroxylaminobenzene mutase
MDATDRAHRLFFHGMALVVVGLVMGAVIQSLANPRLGLSAHTGTLVNGVLVIAMGAFWTRLTLSPTVETIAWWLVVAGSWVSSVALFLAAAFGTNTGTPLHGAQHPAAPWQEALVGTGLVGGGVAVLTGCTLALWGLRRTTR